MSPACVLSEKSLWTRGTNGSARCWTKTWWKSVRDIGPCAWVSKCCKISKPTRALSGVLGFSGCLSEKIWNQLTHAHKYHLFFLHCSCKSTIKLEKKSSNFFDDGLTDAMPSEILTLQYTVHTKRNWKSRTCVKRVTDNQPENLH